MADGSWRRRTVRWTPDRVATALVPARDALVEQLPRELAAARDLTPDQCELVIDEAIDHMVTEYAKPILDEFELARAFWAAASFRVRRVHEGRGATVRAGWRRVDFDDLQLPANDGEPEAAVVAQIEHETLLEFAATLTSRERDVLACKYQGDRELGRVLVAQRLGLAATEVRQAERSILRKLERFAAVLAAGSLCSHREAAVLALAEGVALADQADAARAHLQHCGACRIAYASHLNAIKSGAVQRRLGELLPLPAAAEVTERRRGGPWESVWDWLGRPFAHDSAISFAQIAAASRGVGAIVAAKIAALCVAGGVLVGGGLYCVERLSQHPPKAVANIERTPRHHRSPPEAALPTAGRSAAAKASSVVVRKRRATRSQHSTGTAFASGPAATRHEREAPISPAATTSSGASVPEFGPAPANVAAAQPAAAPAGGAPEFP
jgi:hypothetical protein